MRASTSSAPAPPKPSSATRRSIATATPGSTGTRGLRPTVAALAVAIAMAGAASAQPMKSLPGVSYQVLASGPSTGPLALRGDTVSFKYVGRFPDGEVFSTSPQGGRQPLSFAVHDLIPGMSAALQLMRPGDHWKISVPSYLGYGQAGR